MRSETQNVPISKSMFWAGTVLTTLIVLFLLMDGAAKFSKSPHVIEPFTKLGYPLRLAPVIAIIELACTILYLIPRTAMLGAILLTAFLGGATAAKVRLEDPWILFSPAFGVLMWLGLFFRDARLRALVPLRSQRRS